MPHRGRLAWLAGLAIFAGCLSVLWWANSLLLPANALDAQHTATLSIRDRHGHPLREVLARPDGRTFWVSLAHISPHVIAATVASEDQRFFDHQGVDYNALVRATLINSAKERVVSGGSTLTMQLIRLLRPRRRTLRHKVEEAILATRLEKQLSKAQILHQYLNRAPYGNGTRGVEAAARRYFGKSAAEVSLAQAAVLAALPRWPSGYNPFRKEPQGFPLARWLGLWPSTRSRRAVGRQALISRQRYILRAMHQQGRIDDPTLRLALAEPIDFERASRPFFAPHFTRWMITLAKRSDGVLGTSLHLLLQRRIARLVRQKVASLAASGVSNAAALVVDNATGEVLAHVGSANFFDRKHAGQIDGTLALRQPGSTIKPFTYALALEQGAHPAKLLADIPAQFHTRRGAYAPRNYDERFRGPVRLRVALASSLNVPAVRLTELVGTKQLLSRLHRLGFASLRKPAEYYGLGLTLGNGEVTLRELVAAFMALARGGSYLPLRPLLSSTKLGGAVAPVPRAKPRRVFDRQVSYLIADILSDPRARASTFGRDGPLETPFFAAVKTGTSKDFRDNWTVGYNKHITVGVWVGNFDGESMHNVSGVTGAAPLWREIFTESLQVLGRPRRRPNMPSGLTEIAICPVSGQLVGPHCPLATNETFARTRPHKRCTFHQQLRLDRRNGLLASSRCAERHIKTKTMLVPPPRYLRWARRNGLRLPPTEYSPLCPSARKRTAQRVKIRYPNSGDAYAIDPDLARNYQSVPLEAEVNGRGIKEVKWWVNGRLVGRAKAPYSSRFRAIVGQHRIVAMLPDGTTSRPVTITIR